MSGSYWGLIGNATTINPANVLTVMPLIPPSPVPGYGFIVTLQFSLCLKNKSQKGANVTINNAATEARLLKRINTWHCEGFYGRERFTETDKFISLEDLTKFYEYLDFAFTVLHSGGKT